MSGWNFPIINLITGLLIIRVTEWLIDRVGGDWMSGRFDTVEIYSINFKTFENRRKNYNGGYCLFQILKQDQNNHRALGGKMFFHINQG